MAGSIGEIWEKIKTDFMWGQVNQPSVVDEPYSMPPHGGQAETHASMEEDDCDENIIFEEDEEEDEGHLFGGQDADARHFRANIRYFNGHFSFTSLYCKLDRVTIDMKNCGIYTFRAHGRIYHNIRSFGKEDGHEPRHLELYFYDDDPSLEHRLRKCREKSAKKTGNVVLQGKDRSIHGIRSYHGCYDALSYPLFFPRGELEWHNCIPKVVIHKARVDGGGDDDAGKF
uniref:Uncharacterized protein n=1 Tax=Setaria italica TaxID=4555 RepID=K3YN64_SETIT